MRTIDLSIQVGRLWHSHTILAAAQFQFDNQPEGEDNMKRFPVTLVVVALTLAACGGGTATPGASSSGGPSKVASIAAEVPSSVPTPIQIATDATYPPDESIDPTTGAIVGWDIDFG